MMTTTTQLKTKGVKECLEIMWLFKMMNTEVKECLVEKCGSFERMTNTEVTARHFFKGRK